MVVGRGYFLHASSHSENLASARQVPDPLLMKPKARSGQIRKFSFFDLLDCEQVTWVLSPTRAMACAIHPLWSLQFCSNKYYLFSFSWKYCKRHLILTLCLACENIRFSSLFVDGDVSRGGTSATQRQKFHTDDVKSVRNPVRSADWSTE